MNDCPYSEKLLEWATMAHYGELSFKDSAWVLGETETRWWLRSAGGLYTLTKNDRGGEERFIMEAADIEDVERYLITLFGFGIRSDHGLRMISGTGVVPEGVNPAYHLREVAWAKVAVINTITNQTRVIIRGGLGTSASDATEFSWIADASLEDLRASYLDPDGLPLFPGCQTIQDPAIRAKVERAQGRPIP